MEERFMERAFQLAKRGAGWVSPNPMVGAVLVKDGEIIGEGWHKQFGGPHAEVEAIRDAEKKGKDPKGATMYVTLEPCSHYGKTPPCAELLIKKEIRKVVSAIEDPNPAVAGKGHKLLRESGVMVQENVLREMAEEQNEAFFHWIRTGRPLCRMKAAMTWDGKICTTTGESKWITGEKARGKVHEMRHEHMAIMVGIETVLRDDPTLTARRPESESESPWRNPIRLIVDSRGRTPLSARVFQSISEAPLWIAVTEEAPKERVTALEKEGARIFVLPTLQHRIDLKALMEAVGKNGVHSVLLEGGSRLNWGALEAGIVQNVSFFLAPKLFGGAEAKGPIGGEGVRALSDHWAIKNIRYTSFGEDLLIEGQLELKGHVELKGHGEKEEECLLD